MKKLCLLVLCFSVSIVVYSQTLQRAILSHEGTLTQYDGDHWLDAIDNAVAGDIVYLTPGTFYGNLTVTKAISIIGSGIAETDAFYNEDELATAFAGCGTSTPSTVIHGDINIAIPGSITLTSTLLEGILVPCYYGFEPSVTISKSVTNPIFKRCHFGWYLSASEEVTNLKLEDCYIGRLRCNNVTSAVIFNCWISQTENGYNLDFTNCFVGSNGGNGDTHNCHFINSIVLDTRDYNTFSYCVTRNQNGAGNSFSNCKVDDVDWFFYRYTKAQLLEHEYIGDDGKVMGPLGGPVPFTLKPSNPYVSSSTLTYNSSTKKLNVSMTIKKGE